MEGFKKQTFHLKNFQTTNAEKPTSKTPSTLPSRLRKENMGRYSGNTSYGHRWRKIGVNEFIISWIYDKYYAGSRLRFPQHRDKYVDLKGCIKFCKKWGIEQPKEI
jgi:hypothetical protein